MTLAGRYFSWLAPLAALLVLLEMAIINALYPALATYMIASPLLVSLGLLAVATAVLGGVGVATALLTALLEKATRADRAARWAGTLTSAVTLVSMALPTLMPNFREYSFPSYRVVASGAILLVLLVLAWALGGRLFRTAGSRSPSTASRALTAAIAALAVIGFLTPDGLSLEAMSSDPPRREATAVEVGRVPVVLISVDTLRASHMSLYGYELPTTPHLAAWAEDQVVFQRAITTKSSTVPALSSLLTGLQPNVHGAVRNSSKLDPDHVTLAELLGRNGYHSAGFIANSLAEGALLGQGFDEFTNYGFNDDTTAGRVLGDAAEWLVRNPHDPFFLWVHLIDPHNPYLPPGQFGDAFAGNPMYERYDDVDYEIREEFPLAFLTHVFSPTMKLAPGVGAYSLTHAFGKDGARLSEGDARSRPGFIVSQYDGEIAYMDAQIAPFLATLERAAPDAIVLFTADHGESMVEHSLFFRHSTYCYEPTAHVPLILAHPSFEARRVPELVSLVDVFPTLVELLGLEAPGPLQGASLAPHLLAASEGAATREDRFVRTEAMGLPGYRTLALQNARWKLILTPLRAYLPVDALLEAHLGLAASDVSISPLLVRHYYVELFDLESDAAEESNRASVEREEVASLSRRLWEWVQAESELRLAAGAEAEGPPGVASETKKLLEALGYVVD